MGFCGKMCHLLFMRLLPILVVAVAAFIGWLGSQEVPEGTFFATLIPVLGGYLPPPITGPWTTPGTKEVPADLAPVPRPVGEILLKLPGGSQMPANGLGMCCRPTAYDPESVRRTVLWYLLLGGRHIDDADVYWNHGPVGEAIHEGVARGVPRSEIFVTTKLFPRFYGQNATVTAVHRFLKELGLDYLDLVLMHAPAHPLGAYGECVGKSYKECRQETWQALSSLRAQGLIREIGVSNFNVRQMEEIRELQAAPIAANQFQFNPWVPDWLLETYAYCQQHGIVVTAYASLGMFFQKAQTETVATLKDLASTHGKSVSQVLLRWALQKKVSVIPGTGNPKHMKENLEVYGFQFSDAEMASIDALRSDPSGKAFFFTPQDDS
ncbi:unnamed protein product [Polarella glacialis]|uniref:NADP-dependent oxidoreductase domain-containing protein n=1 Tax=Polarella glacialis TaxID=89957 RepID=A0A813JRH5_POLGL|nr:unnamed protein product [Polarella glacialis]